ncbi:flagellar motor protein MotB [Paenibacillus sp. MBLB4367]|uniref:flagellar motor protein MotB n=1 Tax=Paenibacillus sp. MBLB4367 TaxID=3384767 RepID=UPI0039080BC4
MARRNKGKHQEHENHERWLITYADLITLLLIFFVIMYAMSKVDKSKFDILAQTLHYQFKKSDTMVPSGSGFIGSTDIGRGTDGEEPRKSDTTEETEAQKKMREEREKKEKELQDLLQKINQYVTENQLQNQVFVADTQRGVAVTLNDLFLFDLGKADLKQGAFPVLDKLSSLFQTLKAKISIEGHTDNLPLATGSAFKDNLGLSFERSASVSRYFTDKSKLPADMFISAAYADTKPVAPNDTAENRQKNRRVEIIVLRENP